MACLDFPPQEINGQPPLDGTIWTAPNGRQWVYSTDVPGWRSLAFFGPGIVYRGGIDLTQDPASQYANIVSGNLFTVTVGADPTDGNFYPGLAGDAIQRGDQIIFDGSEYQLIDSSSPLATETVPGIIYLATQEEVNAGTNSTDAVTPATLSNYVENNTQAPLPNGNNGQYLTINNNNLVFQDLPRATTTVEGITRYATDAEALAGTEQNAAITPSNLNAVVDEIASPVPTGAVFWFAAPDAPTGYLVCDGSVVDENTYPTLYNLISTTYGQMGQLPDLRDQFIRGATDGNPVGTRQQEMVGSHDHTATSSTDTNVNNFGLKQRYPTSTYETTAIRYEYDPNAGSGSEREVFSKENSRYYKAVTVSSSHSHEIDIGDIELNSTSTTTTTVNPSSGTENRPKNVALLPCIKY
jgi:hypothetical protein